VREVQCKYAMPNEMVNSGHRSLTAGHIPPDLHWAPPLCTLASELCGLASVRVAGRLAHVLYGLYMYDVVM